MIQLDDRLIDEGSPTWPYVLHHARQMELKLEENRHKGDREGWLNCSKPYLLNRLLHEVAELMTAVYEGDVAAVVKESADVSNYSMMLADKVCFEDEHPPEAQCTERSL